MYECMSVYLPEIAYCTTHFIVEKNIIILPLARREISIWIQSHLLVRGSTNHPINNLYTSECAPSL